MKNPHFTHHALTLTSMGILFVIVGILAVMKLLYVSAESGHVTVFREQGKTPVSEGEFFLPHAHTVCVDPDTHLVYFPLQDIDGHPILRIMEPAHSN